MFIALYFWIVAASAAPVIGNPDWVERPNGDAFSDHYPIKAMEAEIGGRATIQCRVNSLGRLNNCSVISESPKDYGFGLAAIEMSGLFRMKPATIDGLAVSGAWVRIPLVFAVDGEAPDAMVQLNDVIQCYGLFASLRVGQPENQTIARAADWYREWVTEQARVLGVSADDVEARLGAAQASPPRDPELTDWCRTPG